MKMKSAHLLFITFWLLISFGVSLTWSSSINSILFRSFISSAVDVSRDLIESIANGAQMAMDHCQNVFKWDKWNCPESAFSRRRKEIATREQAVVHAIVSAGLVHAVTRNCSKGLLKGCGCNSKLQGSISTGSKYILKSSDSSTKSKKIKAEWSWGGCSDDVEFGQSVAKNILDDLEIGSDAQTYANLHNNLVGRTIVRNMMTRKCRCHGVSGSCSLQTCWMQVVPFTKIAEVIRQRYKKAIRTNVQNRVNSVESSLPMVSQEIGDISSHQLVYIEKSPDYCKVDNVNGWPGTKGRSCSRSHLDSTTLLEKRSCRNLCRNCGYRVRKHKRQVKKNCNCSFKWCCEVKCDICTETVEEFFCD